MEVTSRWLLLGCAVVLVCVLFVPAVWTAAAAQTRLADYPFTLGVASGDPMDERVVIWTRLAIQPQALGAGMGLNAVPVRWEVAEDETLTRTVARGEMLVGPETGHALHIDVGGLK